MDNPPLQTPDQPETNPLPPASPKKPKVIKGTKMLLVVSFVILSLLLFTIALAFSKKLPQSSLPSSTFPPTAGYRPTDTPTTGSIPTQYLLQFRDINKEIQTREDFLPPQIDPNIGL